MTRYCWLFNTFKMFSSQIKNTHVLCSSNKLVVCDLSVTTFVSANNANAGLFSYRNLYNGTTNSVYMVIGK